MVAVSSCLVGVKCRYNGKDSYNPLILESLGANYVVVCPEILAGFGTPRAACEIVGGSGEDVLVGDARVVDKRGADITEAMINGARSALRICIAGGVSKAYLQSRSPTCGCGEIYDGSFSNALRPGNGIFAALLKQRGIEVISV